MPDLQFYKCWADHQDPKVPEKALLDWWCTPDKQYHCIFCGSHGPITNFQIEFPYTTPVLKSSKVGSFQACRRCKEYKGIEPCIPGYCLFGEE